MLYTLPIELVRDIVQIITPIEYRCTTYPERQATLLSLCLTSKLLREIAQPLLFSVVNLTAKDVIAALQSFVVASGTGTKMKWTRVLVLDGCAVLGQRSAECPTTWPPLASFTSLTTLSFSSSHEHCLSEFNLPNLVKLHLAELFLEKGSLSFVLPNLLELSLVDVHLESEGILFPAAFPSLQHFAYRHRDGKNFVNTPYFIDCVNKFHSICFNLDLLDYANPPLDNILRPRGQCILYDVDPDFHPNFFTYYWNDKEHLQLLGSTNKTCSNLFCALKSLLDAQVRPCLRSLYLPLSELESPPAHVRRSPGLDSLLEICHRKGIEVIFEEQALDDWTESPVSREFTRRVMRDAQGQGEGI